jgi:hypothetical protein
MQGALSQSECRQAAAPLVPGAADSALSSKNISSQSIYCCTRFGRFPEPTIYTQYLSITLGIKLLYVLVTQGKGLATAVVKVLVVVIVVDVELAKW